MRRLTITKAEREQLRIVRTELLRHGVVEYRLVAKRRHKVLRWNDGSVVLASTPSDRKGLIALRADVRRQCRKTAGPRGPRRDGCSRSD